MSKLGSILATTQRLSMPNGLITSDIEWLEKEITNRELQVRIETLMHITGMLLFEDKALSYEQEMSLIQYAKQLEAQKESK